MEKKTPKFFRDEINQSQIFPCTICARKLWIETFSPETGSVTGSSTADCLRNTLPLVARNRILSKAMDFSLGTSPEMEPNFTCFDESIAISWMVDPSEKLFNDSNG